MLTKYAKMVLFEESTVYTILTSRTKGCNDQIPAVFSTASKSPAKGDNKDYLKASEQRLPCRGLEKRAKRGPFVRNGRSTELFGKAASYENE